MAKGVSLRHFRCFVAVADTGSFTVAAGRLFLTQSALTATIQQLEACIGLRLFDRTTRRVEMTDAAIRLKTAAEKIICDFDTAIGELQAVAGSQRGLVRIAAAPTMVTHIVSPMLKVFKNVYPDINVVLLDRSSAQIEHLVLTGEIDFGICNCINSIAGLTYTQLVSDPFGVMCPADHDLALRDGDVAWSDLESFDYTGLLNDTGIGAHLENVKSFSSATQQGARDWTASTASMDALLNLGGKISVLPSLAAQDLAWRGFVFRILVNPRLNREICLITRESRSLSPNTQRMIEILTSTVRDIKYHHATAKM